MLYQVSTDKNNLTWPHARINRQTRKIERALSRCLPDATQEFLTQTNPPGLVPGIGSVDVTLRFGCDDQFSGHVGCALSAGLPPKTGPTQDYSASWPSVGQALPSATHGLEFLQALMRGHPKGLQPTEVSLTGSGRKST
jgi:hypothetical protein